MFRVKIYDRLLVLTKCSLLARVGLILLPFLCTKLSSDLMIYSSANGTKPLRDIYDSGGQVQRYMEAIKVFSHSFAFMNCQLFLKKKKKKQFNR